MERNTTHLYEVLGVPKTSSSDEIKRAYRRLALLYHPDKNPGAGEQFKAINHAYEILGDNKKRRIFDKYGEMGVNMLGSLPLFDPEFESMFCAISIIFTFFIILGILFLVFVVTKVDGSVRWNWTTVFVPVWIFIAVIAIVIFPSTLKLWLESDEAEVEEEEESLEESSSDTDGQFRRGMGDKSKRRASFVRNYTIPIYFLLFCFLAIFIALRADNVIDWPTALVLSPYFVLEGILFLNKLASYLFAIRVLDSHEQQERMSGTDEEYPSFGIGVKLLFLWNTFDAWALRVVQSILITLRIDNFILCSWGIVFIPLYIWGLKLVLGIAFLYIKLRYLPQEMAIQGKTAIVILAVMFGMGGSLFYTTIWLLTSFLDGGSVPLAIVFIPMFIVLGLICCCTGCCFPLLLLGPMVDIQDSDSTEPLISSSRLITYGEASSSRA
ncbi:uncharacterized protein VTP21DRAFT_3933 [Calcarisporiella thermophila]|uniref:uncharacterized protein n=1 Tax=Calcarisporiella thermophila TaxID=911321 RepID=UPI003743DBA4